MLFPREKFVHATLIYTRSRLDSKTKAVELVQASKGVDQKEFLCVAGTVEMQISNPVF